MIMDFSRRSGSLRCNSLRGLAKVVATGLFAMACSISGATEFPAPPATASTFGSSPAWADSCEATTDLQKKVVDATVFIVPESLLTSNGDGTWALANDTFDSFTDGTTSTPLCPNFPFFGQPSALAGRSGFVVGKNTIMTTPHNLDYDPLYTRVIFGLSSHKDPSGSCVMPDFDHIPDSNVRTPNGVLVNGLTGSPVSDYMVFTLAPKLFSDRTGEPAPLRIRRSGQLESGDEAFVVGYPYRLSSKVDLAAYFTDPKPLLFGPEPLPLGVGVAGAHQAAGSSGGPLFNIDKQMVESTGGHSFGNWAPMLDTTQNPACWIGGESESSPWAFNFPIDIISAQVPANELLVAPLVPVTYESPVGTPIVPAVTNYTITAPSNISSPIQYTVSAPQLSSTSPYPSTPPNVTSSIPPGTYSLSPGQSTTLTVTSDASPVTSCRRWVSKIEITDVTHGWTDKIEHRFDIGTTEYTVTPSEDVAFEEIAPPYTNTTSYVVSNSRPVSVLVIVDALVPWLEVTGPTGIHGSRVTVRLEPKGTPGDSATIVAGLVNSEAELLPRHQTYDGQVRFAYGMSSCAADATWRYRNISFHPGRHTYLADWSAEDTTLTDSPGPGQYGTPFARSISVSSGGPFCVSSIVPEFGFANENGTLSAPFPDLASQLRLELGSPEYSGVLWDLQPATDPAYFRTESFLTQSGGHFPAGVIHFEQGISPPPVNSLSNYIGRKGDGQWSFSMQDGVPGQGEIFALFGRLLVTGEPGCQ